MRRRNLVLLIGLLLAMIMPVSLYARVVTSEVYNGITYTKGYVYDFQVDSIFYTIHENGVYVSAEKRLFGSKGDVGGEVIINSSYYGTVTIPETVMYGDTVYNIIGIDDAAFKGCNNLDSISIPNSVSHIGPSAFYGCTNLKDVLLPSLLTVIERTVFMYCSSLESISFPEKLKKIGVASFRGCTSLKTIYIPDGVEIIDSLAFDRCTAMHLLSVPSSVREIGIAAFQLCQNIDSLFWNSEVSFSLGDIARWNRNTLRYVRLGGELTRIEQASFMNCEYLTSIIIPKKVEYIDFWAFNGCIRLKKVVIEGSPIIYEGAFADCYIDSVFLYSEIPPTEGYHYYEQTTFEAWYRFSSRTYENAMLSIPNGAFEKYAASDTWSRFSSLYSLPDMEYKSDIENDTIYYIVQDDGAAVAAKAISCYSFKEIIGFDGPLTPRDPDAGGLQPRSITRSNATETDSSYYTHYSGNIVIPESVSANDTAYTVTGINYYAFIGSEELESVYIPESVNHIGFGCFAGCSALSTVNIPSGVTKIPVAMFYGCSSLVSIKIPERVLCIGQCAFAGCEGLTEITIPAGVKLIDKNAFAYCGNLKRVVIKGDPLIAETAFLGCGTELEVIRTRVETIETTDSDSNVDEEVHYSIDGRMIPADFPGLHIIKYRNGTVRKAVVR